jgi:3-deoxy-D-manno-octulosonic-acid transferase
VTLPLRLAYQAAANLARVAAVLAPPGDSKIARSLRGRRGIRARYRSWSQLHRESERELVWMHAPSVGEGLQARPVLHQLRERRPDLQLAYTYFSPSAVRFADALDVDFRDFLPFDTNGDARAALDALQPAALIFSKVDVWPTLVRTASRRSVRLGMISATLAESSGRGRGAASRLLADAYARLDRIGAIDPADAERLVTLGAKRDAVVVTGDTRYDQVWARARSANTNAPLIASLSSPRPTLVAGSTWPADERVLLPAWEALRRELSGARLVLAPHEPTLAHVRPIMQWAERARLHVRLLSDAPMRDGDDVDVIVVDRVGVLGDLYALAGIAFVGGGFHAAGLHSVLEPAAFGAPVVFGPRFTASRDARLLVEHGGAFPAASTGALAAALRSLLGDESTRRIAGASARQLVEGGLGAAERSVALVESLLR